MTTTLKIDVPGESPRMSRAPATAAGSDVSKPAPGKQRCCEAYADGCNEPAVGMSDVGGMHFCQHHLDIWNSW